MPEQSQVEQTAESQAEATESQVENTTDVVEQVGQLLTTETQDESQEEIQDKTQETKEEVAPVQVEPVIDDTMINEYPALKMYKGKPLKDLGKAYQNIVKAFTENQMRLKQIEKERAKRSIPEPTEVPDPVENPDEFKKYMETYAASIKQQAIDEYLSQAKVQTDWVAEARKIVPDGVDFNKFNQEFMMFNAERFYNELGEVRPEVENFYNANPQVLISEMKKYYELTSQANKNKSVIEKEGKDTAYKTITNSLKKAQENKDDQLAQFNAVERSTQVTPEDEILANIYKIAQG
jgi:hypothetical protein